MDNKKLGNLLGFASLVPVFISMILFYIVRGPNADIYSFISLSSAFAISGVLFAIFSWLLARRFFLLLIGLLSNGLVFVFTFFLLLAMGIGEP